jgi:hypothetical protein
MQLKACPVTKAQGTGPNAIAMTMLSVQLTRSLARGRHLPAPEQSRASLLLMLLRKRATAHNVGADELEMMLRDQIRWALPMMRDEDFG